jgi:hypothetical protein
LNLNNNLYDADSNVLVFVDGVDTSASNSRYLDVDANAQSLYNELELEEFILTAIEQRIRKNNVYVASRMVKKTTKKA